MFAKDANLLGDPRHRLRHNPRRLHADQTLRRPTPRLPRPNATSKDKPASSFVVMTFPFLSRQQTREEEPTFLFYLLRQLRHRHLILERFSPLDEQHRHFGAVFCLKLRDSVNVNFFQGQGNFRRHLANRRLSSHRTGSNPCASRESAWASFWRRRLGGLFRFFLSIFTFTQAEDAFRNPQHAPKPFRERAERSRRDSRIVDRTFDVKTCD